MLNDLLQPSLTAPIASAVVSAFLGINTLILKWILNKFTDLSKDIRASTELSRTWLASHEHEDQSRHEENLYRFEKISVALAKLGADNGTHIKGKR